MPSALALVLPDGACDEGAMDVVLDELAENLFVEHIVWLEDVDSGVLLVLAVVPPLVAAMLPSTLWTP